MVLLLVLYQLPGNTLDPNVFSLSQCANLELATVLERTKREHSHKMSAQ